MQSRILVVDDEAPIRNLLVLVLEQEGLLVDTAPDVPQAMALCENAHYDFVLADVSMPGMDGHALMRWLEEHYPGIPRGLMTGFDPGCTVCPTRSGCSILNKPFLPADAVAFVRRGLDPATRGGVSTSFTA